MKLKPLVHGIASFVPGASSLHRRGTGGTGSAGYCYSVWLRHLVMAKSNGLSSFPRVVAELGPGDSLGIGLAALISGCEKYYAFDVVDYAKTERNLDVFDSLVEYFENRAAIPAGDEFPKVRPALEVYDFPADILNEDRLRHALDKSRLENIRESIRNTQRGSSSVQYRVPWDDSSILERESVDMIYSQAVLEHVDDLRSAYRAMWLWLKSTGYISHQVDFGCHGTADEWNGHWKYSDVMWRLMRGRRPYLLNREPHSAHLALLKEAGFDVVCDRASKTESVLRRDELASRFRSITDDDLTTGGAFVQAVKTGNPMGAGRNVQS